jgi:hypothetical protein
MSFHKLRSLGIIAATTLLALSYQNCARTNFGIDDAAKEAKIAGAPVMGGGVVDTGEDTGTPGQVDPGDDTPTTPGTNNPPGSDTPSTPPGTKNPPGSDTPSTPPSTQIPPGTDTPVTGTLFQDVTNICPMLMHTAKKTLLQAKGKVKLVYQFGGMFSTNGEICEVLDVKDQIDKKRKIDITKCSAQLKANKGMLPNMYLVEESVTSNFAANKMNESDFYMSNVPMDIAYTMYTDTANAANCDIMGDPLLIQLSSKSGQADPINLTSAQNGVLFNLLGRRNDNVKVQSAWFADNKSENYFLVLPDSDGQVNGIDQLFGDATFGPDKRFSKQGFQALAKYDSNKDKVISFDDPVFMSLRLWKDDNLDGIAQANELFTLDAKGIVAIDLRYDRRYKEYDQYGNMVKYKSVVVMKDNSLGLVFDLWLRYIPQ